jgi:LysR family glycine cleavage system transcriptional activator
MQRLPLNTLPAFRAVADLQNLRAAAERLHLTHSAVSQQVRLLETQLGFPLFDRRGRRVVLNDSGKVLLRSVQSALRQLDEGMQAASAAALGVEHRLRISALPSFAQRWLLPRIRRWRERYPDIHLEIDATQQAVDLRRQGFHAALRQGVGPWEGLESECLFDGPLSLFAFGSGADAHRLAGREPADLLGEPLIGGRELWQSWFAAAGVDARIAPVAEFNDLGLMLQACEQGLGLVLAPELLAADALVAGSLIRLSPVSVIHPDHQSYHLVYPPRLRDWPPLDALRQWLRMEIDVSREEIGRARAL